MTVNWIEKRAAKMSTFRKIYLHQRCCDCTHCDYTIVANAIWAPYYNHSIRESPATHHRHINIHTICTMLVFCLSIITKVFCLVSRLTWVSTFCLAFKRQQVKVYTSIWLYSIARIDNSISSVLCNGSSSRCASFTHEILAVIWDRAALGPDSVATRNYYLLTRFL